MTAAYELPPDPRVLLDLMPLLGTYQAADRRIDRLGDLTGKVLVIYHDHVVHATNEFAERLLRGLAATPVTEVVFVGDSPLEPLVRQWTARLGLEHLVRHGTRGDMIGLYDRDDPR